MNLARRLWVYQAERFPLGAHGLLVAALVLGSVGYATQSIRTATDTATGGDLADLNWPQPWVAGVAFVVTLGFFLQLRIFDEFKDAADDAAYRPYRPVPRGLVSLRELSGVGLVVAMLQLGATVWVAPSALFYLLLVWGAMGLLAREFFVAAWLRAHPLAYLASHMIILPLLLLYNLVLVWLASSRADMSLLSLPGIGWFLGAGYANGVVFEIGRKVRAPEDEEHGVETYSALWGIGRASWAWWLAVVVAAVCALWTGVMIGRPIWLVVTAMIGAIGCAWAAWQMARSHARGASKWIERASALWVLALYSVFAILGISAFA